MDKFVNLKGNLTRLFFILIRLFFILPVTIESVFIVLC